MNPLIITTGKKIFTNKYVLITIAVIVIFLFAKGGLKNLLKKHRESKFDKDETKDYNQIAQQYRSASNPSGTSWMIDFDGTDNDAVERLAYQTKGSFQPIAEAYKMKFDETLTDRMRKELNSDEFQNWKNIID